MTWERRENLYHQENRYIRTQLYKNILHLSFQKYTSQNCFWEIFLLCGIKWGGGGGEQFVSIETVQHNSEEFSFGPLVC